MRTIVTTLITWATRRAGTGHRRAGMTRSGTDLVPAGGAGPCGQASQRRRERRPRIPAGRSRRGAGAVVATAALAALPLAIMGSGTALASPASPASLQAAAATRTVSGPLPSTASAAAPARQKAAASPGSSGLGDPETWMGDLGPELWDQPLSQIVIPGTHDSLTYSMNNGLFWNDWAQTQDEDLTGQLNGGMRAFDIRVGWHDDVSNGYGYYANHGGLYSSWLKLPSVLTSIDQWALQPGQEHEVILLSLAITQSNNGPFPTQDCQNFAATLGGSLVTPDELQAHFGTTDPGQVTLGQLWSLPDPKNAARVIMNNDQCMDAGDPSAGQWAPDPPFGVVNANTNYYANQCTADGIDWFFQGDGIQRLVLQAARSRFTQGDGGEPDSFGPPMNGGIWALFIQGTPEADCPIPPAALVPAEQEVLDALVNQWVTDPATQQNVNIVSGDFFDEIELYQDVIRMDEDYPLAANTVTATGTTQLTASQADVSVPASAFTATASYQGPGAPTGLLTPGQEITYHVVSQPVLGTAGFGDEHLPSVTVQAGDQGVVSPGADLYLNRDHSQGTVTVTASAAGVATTWTVVIGPATGFRLEAPDGLIGQAGQTFTYAPGVQYSTFANAFTAQGVQLPGVPVTFDIKSVGTFPGGGTSVTRNTNAGGAALAPPFTAATRAGTYSITLSAPGAVSTPSFKFTIRPGPATAFVVTRGGGQTVPVNTKFPAALQGHWVDQYGNVVTNPPPADQVLTLSPSSGATWPNGQSSIEATVAADGTITAPDLTAGHTMLEGPDAAHSLTVNVGPASVWTLHVAPGPPAEVIAISGDGQHTAAGKPFGKALAVMVLDAAGNPIPGAAVTFQVTKGQATFALPPGAAAYFGSKLSAASATGTVVVTGSGGVATAPVLTAGQQGGPIQVTAAAGAAAASKTTVVHLSATGPPGPPAITGLSNGDGQVSVAFSGSTGGSAPITSYTVAATDQNAPTAPAVTATGPSSPITVKGLTNGDPYVFAVRATSADGSSPWSTPSGALSVGVAPVIAAGPADGTVGTPYSSGFTVTGAPPPTVTQVSGTVPPGLTLASDGALTGTPTQAGSYEFTVQAANPVGIDDASITVAISATLGAGPPGPGGRQLRATICTRPAGHRPVCAVRTLTGSFPPLRASAAATLVHGAVTYAAGRVSPGYRKLTFTRWREIPAGGYTLILRYRHHAIIVPVTISPAGYGHPAAAGCATSGSQVTCVFRETGAAQSWTAPAGVASATVTLYGAQGVSPTGLGLLAGLGAEVTAYDLPVTAGTALQVNVGQAGAVNAGRAGYKAAFGGGGAAGSSAGGGGGASDIRSPASPGSYPLANRLLVAGGGGGGGAISGFAAAGGNAGSGGMSGASESNDGNYVGGGAGGGAGTSTGPGAGGAGGTASSSCSGVDGAAGSSAGTGTSQGTGGAGGPYAGGGGGGGGGYYGGGGGGGGAGDNCFSGGGGGGGGGGASYTGAATGAVVTDGVAAPDDAPNGEVIITYQVPTATTTTVVSSVNPSAAGQQVVYIATVSPAPDGGTVAFADGGSTISGCRAQPVGTITGTAICPVTYTSAGTHSITAAYSGDTAFAASTSAALPQTVNPAAGDHYHPGVGQGGPDGEPERAGAGR